MTRTETVKDKAKDHLDHTQSKAHPAVVFAKQAAKLGQYDKDQEDNHSSLTHAAEAKFITAQDPVIETINGGRLPAVPLEEAYKLNELKDHLEDREASERPTNAKAREARDGSLHGVGSHEGDLRESAARRGPRSQSPAPDVPLGDAVPPSKTNPLFPPLPMYGPPTLHRTLQCWIFRVSSTILSLCFLGTIVLGAIFTYVPLMFRYLGFYIRLQHPDTARPFYQEEKKRAAAREESAEEWKRLQRSRQSRRGSNEETTFDEESRLHGATAPKNMSSAIPEKFVPTEGGTDLLKCDVGYYARREGLESETYLVQTEDGFIIELWHIFNPLTYKPQGDAARQPHAPELFPELVTEKISSEGHGYGQQYPSGAKKYPVLLLHGLLQSSGAYCCSGPNSLAFYLAKAGYDVWLGNNRCGFKPRHTMLKYSDPRMWAWNIRQMGVMDLAALVSRVLTETGFAKCALVAHSQGTTQTLVALAKEQRPELGQRLSIVCFLAPAAYAGPLIGKAYFSFMRVISPAVFRIVFGIHAFIPFMMSMHKYLPGRLYGFMGYRVFSFLFNWTDDRWDRGLRNRCFIFAPVYVSSESMRWWLGRDCFARQKCILATRRETEMEDQEDEEDDQDGENSPEPREIHNEKKEDQSTDQNSVPPAEQRADSKLSKEQTERGRFAWYDEMAPPMAFWVAGSDDLVDGRRLLKRFQRGREPHVKVVHTKVIKSYEHLDVIWAVDSLEQVGKEVGEVIWKTVNEEARSVCRVPHLDLP